jgi:hypothetical protein
MPMAEAAMLSVLDRHLKFWHVCLAGGAALAWFAAINLSAQAALPGVKLYRCPIGLCFGYYAPVELQATLTRLGKDGRQFLARTLLPLDMVLPALLAIALILACVWFSRPGQATAMPLSSKARTVLLCVPLLYCLADYAENWALAEALEAFPDIPYRLARRASFLTAAKSQLITAAIGIALALAIASWGRAHQRGRRDTRS